MVNLLASARTRSVFSSGRSVEVPPTKNQAQRRQLPFETVDFESTETMGSAGKTFAFCSLAIRRGKLTARLPETGFS